MRSNENYVELFGSLEAEWITYAHALYTITVCDPLR
jgi:hypothetical protein